MKRLLVVFSLSLIPFGNAFAADYDCQVLRKVSSEHTYSDTEIMKSQPSVKIENSGSTAFLSRCSFQPSAGKVTCDRYKVDKIVVDENIGVKKFYVFGSQFDVQLFADNLMVENNGRGGISFGICR